MARPGRMEIAREDILKFFEDSETTVFMHRELGSILAEHRRFWRLAGSTTNQFIEFLIRRGRMQRVELVSEAYKDLTRYVWGAASVFQALTALGHRGRAFASLEQGQVVVDGTAGEEGPESGAFH